MDAGAADGAVRLGSTLPLVAGSDGDSLRQYCRAGVEAGQDSASVRRRHPQQGPTLRRGRVDAPQLAALRRRG